MSNPVAGVTRFLYDGDALVVEYNGGNLMARRHLHWPGADVPMMTWEGAGFDPSHLHADERGSIITVGNANGLPTINRYDEYGIPGAGNVGRFQYTGQAWLAELGMYYYKARIYSPTLGRFMQTDLIGYEDQFNLYAYVGNDPVNGRDPSGEETTCNPDKTRCETRVDPAQAPEGHRAIRADNLSRDNPAFGRDVVGQPATDQASSELAAILDQQSGNEQTYRMDTETSDNGTMVISTHIAEGGENSTPVLPSQVAGAEAIFHTEAKNANTGVPGYGDIHAPERLGVPNYQAFGTRVNAVEISGGRAQIRPVNHNRTTGLLSRARDYQARRNATPWRAR